MVKHKKGFKHLGYTVLYSNSTGGKAGKGLNKTSTLQVIEKIPPGYFIKKQFRFTVGNKESENKAIEKAKIFIKKNLVIKKIITIKCPKCMNTHFNKGYVEGNLRSEFSWGHDTMICVECKCEFTIW